MNSYRYTLQPYKGPGTRYVCPQCKDKRKTLSRYIDTHTGTHLAANVGRCGRQDKCGYHLTPKQYFQHHETPIPVRKKKAAYPYKSRLTDETTTQQDISCIQQDHWQQSLRFPGENNFLLYLESKLGKIVAQELGARYRIGTSKLWKGATVFWQFNTQGICRAGKIMLYNPVTGRRVKEPFNHICWVHALKDEHRQPLYPNYQLKQCLFGEHLLTNDTRDIALVESEKTAILGAHFDRTKLWLATGGKEGLTEARCRILENKRVFLYPDAGAEEKWEEAAKNIFMKHEVVSLTGMSDGTDVGDVWCG
jgi:hypothetical protein